MSTPTIANANSSDFLKSEFFNMLHDIDFPVYHGDDEPVDASHDGVSSQRSGVRTAALVSVPPKASRFVHFPAMPGQIHDIQPPHAPVKPARTV